MASAKELRDRIKAVQETEKITGAMHLISSTKLRRAKADFAQARPYFDALSGAIGDILRVPPDYESRYFDGGKAKADAGVAGILVVTADKGLAGAYNLNALRAAETLRAQKPGACLFVVGEYGRRYFTQRAAEPMVYAAGAQMPSPESAAELSDGLLARYDALELSELYLIYTDMKNSLSSEVRTQRLLPLERGAEKEAARTRTELLPSVDEAVRLGVRTYLRGFLYGALLDSYYAEQNARVGAMDAANRNAEELLDGLSLQLNRQRQGAITREITEISAGAQAQKNAGKRH